MKRHHFYTIFIVLAAVFVAYSIANTAWLQTDLTALLPQEKQDVVLQAADKAGEAQLNSQVILLSGSQNAENAFVAAKQIAAAWQQSGEFITVDSQIAPDLAQIRAEMQQLALATLPETQRRQLLENPREYFQKRAEDAVNPFAATALPLEADWLGFGRYVSEKSNPNSLLQYDAENGMLFTSDKNGKTWVFLRGKLPERRLANPEKLLLLIAESRAIAAEHHAEILSAGGALFSAVAQSSAESESQFMSAIGMILTFALLAWTFRTVRILWLFLPLAAGILVGLAAALAVFGQVHILTIVIGTSLVGMLVDFPLHWLAPSVFAPSNWQAADEMRRVRPSFVISLMITVLGYALLWFTPLSVLRQTAVFSGFALLGAFGATVLWLPELFKNYRGKHTPFAHLTEKLLAIGSLPQCWGRVETQFSYPNLPPQAGERVSSQNNLFKIIGLFLMMIFTIIGLWRSDWHDDIRQWVNMPREMLAEVQQIGELAGVNFSGQYLVAEADSPDVLLRKNAEIRRALQPLIEQKKLANIQALDEWVSPVSEQKLLQNQLNKIAKQPANWQAMTEIGVGNATMQNALMQAADAMPLSLSGSLNAHLSEAWRNLYLGEVAPKRFASIVRLNGMTDAAAVRTAMMNISGAHWADKRAHLNELFHHTRNQAAWLKLVSYALALFILWRIFGFSGSLKILAVPLAAAILTVAALSWLNVPMSLFAMFGLLLVSAIGADYAVYAHTAPHSPLTRLGGMLLAALTTGISFILLAFSNTPAVAAFGLTVTIGVIFDIALAAFLLNRSVLKPNTPTAR